MYLHRQVTLMNDNVTIYRCCHLSPMKAAVPIIASSLRGCLKSYCGCSCRAWSFTITARTRGVWILYDTMTSSTAYQPTTLLSTYVCLSRACSRQHNDPPAYRLLRELLFILISGVKLPSLTMYPVPTTCNRCNRCNRTAARSTRGGCSCAARRSMPTQIASLIENEIVFVKL